MNICIVTHKLLKGDGQARVNYEIVKEVLKRNHRVALYASEVTAELAASPSVSWTKVPVNGWPTQLLKNQAFAAISALKLLPRRKQYDLIMVNGFITWVKSDINAVHFVHSSWLKSPAHPFRLRKDGSGCYQLAFTSLNAALEKVAFARTRYLVPVSEKVSGEIRAVRAAPQQRIIMNGVDVEEFHPDRPDRADRPLSRGQLGLPEHGPLALFAGDIKSPRKNLDSVLRALADVPELQLAVAGSTAGSPYLKLAEQLGVHRRVHFLGYRKDIAELMRCADFFVFPSRYEACTLAVIEALASGLPVITTYQSGVSELVAGARPSGFVLADPEDVAGLGQAMRKLSADPELRRRLGANARETAERQSWQSVAAQYIELFEEAAARKRTNRDAPAGIVHSVRSRKL